MISGVGVAELRARQRRALNEVTIDERANQAPDEPTEFDCECGRPRCDALIRLTPRAFAAFRRDFRGFVVAPGHEVVRLARSSRSDETEGEHGLSHPLEADDVRACG